MNSNSNDQLVKLSAFEMPASSTFYFYDLIAKIGSGLTGFEDSPSINDLGLVAFVGKFGSADDLLVGDGSNPLRNLSSTFSGTRFTRAVQINNNNQVESRHQR